MATEALTNPSLKIEETKIEETKIEETKIEEAIEEEIEQPDITHLTTENDVPVDNLPSEKQQRLLVEPLYSGWQSDRPFLAAANVGLFRAVNQPPVVPDMFLSLDVEVADNWWEKAHRSYFLWEFGKPPEVVIEIVSNTKGQETDKKFQEYAWAGVPYYVIYDPQRLIQTEALTIYELKVGTYELKPDHYLEQVDLGLVLWEGVFEDKQDHWLRWCDREKNLILTGRERADRLAAQLRALGIEPEV